MLATLPELRDWYGGEEWHAESSLVAGLHPRHLHGLRRSKFIAVVVKNKFI